MPNSEEETSLDPQALLAPSRPSRINLLLPALGRPSSLTRSTIWRLRLRRSSHFSRTAPLVRPLLPLPRKIQAPPTATPAAEQPGNWAPDAGPAPTQLPTAHSVYADRRLQFPLHAPSAQGIANTVATRQLYGETGKLNLFQRPTNLAPFPSKRFIPEPEKLFGRIKEADTRDGWEAEVLWNIVYNTENALAASHKVAEALSAGNTQAATEAFSVLHHYL